MTNKKHSLELILFIVLCTMMTKEEKEKVQHLKLIIKEQRRQIDKLISDSKEPGKERYSKTRMVITGAAYLDMIFEKLSQYIDV